MVVKQQCPTGSRTRDHKTVISPTSDSRIQKLGRLPSSNLTLTAIDIGMNYLERLFALLKAHRVRVLGTSSHGELHVDVETVGLATLNVRRPQPVVNSRHGHVTHHVDTVHVTSNRRVTRFSPLQTESHMSCLKNFID